MDIIINIWNYVSILGYILGVPASIISVYVLLYGTPKKGLIETAKYKLSIEKYEKRLKFILRNYKLTKHLTQTPQHRTDVVIMECLRVLMAVTPFLGAIWYYIYIFLKFLDSFLGHKNDLVFNIYLSSGLTSLIAMFLTKILFQKLSPSYHFKTFHKLTVCKIYNILKRMQNPHELTKNGIEELHRIAQTRLTDEIPENELTDLGLAFHFSTYNYPKVVRKQMKKKNYNFETDKKALIDFTERLLKNYENRPTPLHTA